MRRKNHKQRQNESFRLVDDSADVAGEEDVPTIPTTAKRTSHSHGPTNTTMNSATATPNHRHRTWRKRLSFRRKQKDVACDQVWSPSTPPRTPLQVQQGRPRNNDNESPHNHAAGSLFSPTTTTTPEPPASGWPSFRRHTPPSASKSHDPPEEDYDAASSSKKSRESLSVESTPNLFEQDTTGTTTTNEWKQVIQGVLQQQQQQIMYHGDTDVSSTRMALARPFGRTSQQQWVSVEVLDPDYHMEEGRWYYPTRMERGAQDSSSHASSVAAQVTATCRSLEDFSWLEQALRTEYHGSLLLPLLSMSLHHHNPLLPPTNSTSDHPDQNTTTNKNDNPNNDNKKALQKDDPAVVASANLDKVMDQREKVDPKRLAAWLSDVLNGVRGEGEMMLAESTIDVESSEALEAFFYRNTEPLPEPFRRGKRKKDRRESSSLFVEENHRSSPNKPQLLEYNRNRNRGGVSTKEDPNSMMDESTASVPTTRQGDNDDESTIFTMFPFLSRSLACFDTIQEKSTLACNNGCGGNRNRDSSLSPKRMRHLRINLPLEMISCSSRGDSHYSNNNHRDKNKNSVPNISRADSMAWDLRGVSPTASLNGGGLAIHSKLLEAQHALISSRRRTAIRSSKELVAFVKEEAQISVAWKRFAISLSNLFSCEKDIESARVVDAKHKSNKDHTNKASSSTTSTNKEDQPFRKLTKRTVDDGLRVLARQKIDRSMPSLQLLSTMLNAYIADLSTVGPALNAYADAVAEFTEFTTNCNNAPSGSPNARTGGRVEDASMGSRSPSLQDWKHVKTLAKSKLKMVGKQISGTSNSTATTESTEDRIVASDESRHPLVPSRSNLSMQRRALETRLVGNETKLKGAITTLCKASHIRVSRMAWTYFKVEANQAKLLQTAASSLLSQLKLAPSSAIAEMAKNHAEESKTDNEIEAALVQRILDIGIETKYSPTGSDTGGGGNDVEPVDEEDRPGEEEQQIRQALGQKAFKLWKNRAGRWDADLTLALMEAAGVDDALVRVEQTTRDLRLVRKYAIALSENLNRSIEAMDHLTELVVVDGLLSDDKSEMDHNSTYSNSGNSAYSDVSPLTIPIGVKAAKSRKNFLSCMAPTLSGVPEEDVPSKPKIKSRSMGVLEGAGVSTTDRAGWLSSDKGSNKTNKEIGNCGMAAMEYQKVQDAELTAMLSRINFLLQDYKRRVEGIQSFAYMHCVGIQIEKHYSNNRAQALAAWEKKTDITTAINIATRKRLPLLVNELKGKLVALSPTVSHTTVKEAKEKHLTSKALKSELHDLANRQFQRAKEASTVRVVTIMRLWAEFEKQMASREFKVLSQAMRQVELTVTPDDIEADGGSLLLEPPELDL